MRAVDYVDLGRYLHDVRESLNVTVEQAAFALHMRPKYLHDLEEGNLSNMPGKAYIRGYIKNYAEYLRLDSVEVLEEYEKLLDTSGQKFFVPDSTINHNIPSRGILWLSIAGIAAIYSYWYFSVYDHTVIKNTISEVPLSEPGMVKIPGDWDVCLNGNDAACFLELQAKSQLPDASEAFVFVPPVPVLPPAPAEDPKATPDSSPPGDG